MPKFGVNMPLPTKGSKIPVRSLSSVVDKDTPKSKLSGSFPMPTPSVKQPLRHLSSTAISFTPAKRSAPVTPIERQMDNEVEKVLKEWNTNVQTRTEENLRIRTKPASPALSDSKRKPMLSTWSGNSSLLGKADENGRKTFQFPEINLIKREHTSVNASVDSLSEEIPSPLYTDDPAKGKIFRMEFNVDGFNEDNITVKVSGHRLVVHAVSSDNSKSGKTSTTEFCRKIKLPPDVDARQVECYHNPATGGVIVEAPVVPVIHKNVLSRSQMSSSLRMSMSRPDDGPLNEPTLKETETGKALQLTLEIGSVFKATDIVVKMKGKDQILIDASKEDNTNNNKLYATLCREITLPFEIKPETLKAGISSNGLLRLTAQAVDQEDKEFTKVSVVMEDDKKENGLPLTNGHTLDSDIAKFGRNP